MSTSRIISESTFPPAYPAVAPHSTPITTLTTLDYSGGTATKTALPAPAATLGAQGPLGAVLLALQPGSLPGVVIAS